MAKMAKMAVWAWRGGGAWGGGKKIAIFGGRFLAKKGLPYKLVWEITHGGKNGVGLNPKNPKNHQREPTYSLDTFWSKMGPMGPFFGQNWPSQKTSQNASILGKLPQTGQKWPQNRPKIDQKWPPKWKNYTVLAYMALGDPFFGFFWFFCHFLDFLGPWLLDYRRSKLYLGSQTL